MLPAVTLLSARDVPSLKLRPLRRRAAQGQQARPAVRPHTRARTAAHQPMLVTPDRQGLSTATPGEAAAWRPRAAAGVPPVQRSHSPRHPPRGASWRRHLLRCPLAPLVRLATIQYVLAVVTRPARRRLRTIWVNNNDTKAGTGGTLAARTEGLAVGEGSTPGPTTALQRGRRPQLHFCLHGTVVCVGKAAADRLRPRLELTGQRPIQRARQQRRAWQRPRHATRAPSPP